MDEPRIETTVVTHSGESEVRFRFRHPVIGRGRFDERDLCASAPLSKAELASLAANLERIGRLNPGLITGDVMPLSGRPRIGRLVTTGADEELVSEDREVFRLLLPMWVDDDQVGWCRSVGVAAIPTVLLQEIRGAAGRPSVEQIDAVRRSRLQHISAERRRFTARVRRRRPDADSARFDSMMGEIGALGDRDEASSKHLAHVVAALVSGAQWDDAVDYSRPSHDWDPKLDKMLAGKWAEVEAIRSRVGRRRFRQIARSSAHLELFLDQYLGEYWGNLERNSP